MTQTSSSTDLLMTTASSGGARGPVLLAAALLAGLQAGTYFTWATGVMPGLARADDRTFVSAVQEMNVAIVNPLFMATFLGAPALTAVAIWAAGPQARPWTIAATVLAVATVAITIGGNVPLNDALAAAGPVDTIKDLAGVRADFESLWVKLNVARTLTSAGALGTLAWAAWRARG
jgi:uncharacterized membrane protein